RRTHLHRTVAHRTRPGAARRLLRPLRRHRQLRPDRATRRPRPLHLPARPRRRRTTLRHRRALTDPRGDATYTLARWGTWERALVGRVLADDGHRPAPLPRPTGRHAGSRTPTGRAAEPHRS